ncbi:uncharacterized protein SPSK_08412 [Sporothrix schenckii 1099-18]|uniref:Zn(2)-C6 fungal-type domain-containing protein n=1 Tax=Sporothrix schenckii 1099-18 TaxID=1397361 RepID=A0A0F2M8E0_SPOSC|nr:uncharacterized protein SPSK_08412 [Sporothrix schenckii 1099-18]KJR85369.1 hypothetical protein SPSK_08412 [Sporothrix schenckii 1099-18]
MTAARSKKRTASLDDSDDQLAGASMSPSDGSPGGGSGGGSVTNEQNGDASANGTTRGSGGAPPLRKRKRRVVSCAECHRRKQKCDRNMPCKACIDRKMEASCHYETVAMSRERHHMRVLEAASYGRALQAGGSIPVKAAGFGYAQSAANTLGFLNRLDGGRGNNVAGGGDVGEQWGPDGKGPSASGSGTDSATLASMVSEKLDSSAVVPTTEAAHAAAMAQQRFYYQQNGASRFPAKQTTTQQQQHESHKLIHSQHPSFDHQLHQRPQIGDPYGTADRYRALVRELPPRAAIDRLVDTYFKEYNWNYYAIDEDVFEKQLNDWTDVAMGPFGTLQSPNQLSPDLRAFPALLFNVMAMGLLMLEPNNEEHMAFFDGIKHANNATGEDLALDYSEAGMGILSLLGKRQMSFTTVLAAFARGAFLKYVALITEAWHAIGGAIRDAQEVGLHRTSMDPKPWANTAEAVLENQWEIQLRRRLWMTLVSWDIQMGAILGRPITVDPTARMTLPIDCIMPKTYAERSTMPVQARGENDPPTPLSRAIWSFEAISPLRPILEFEKEGPCPRDFSRIDELHETIVEIESRTPPVFRVDNPDTRYDNLPGFAWLPSIRATTPQVIIFNYMALHRPYIFTRAKSRTEALKACIRMLQVQRVYFASLKPQQYKTFSLFFGTFDSLVLMAAIYILFPKEHPELLPDAIQHYRWSVQRFEIMMEHYSLARSALGVLHAIYLRLRKTLGISFLENDHGLGGILGPGAAPVDDLTLSNIDPSLKGDGPVLGAAAAKTGSGGADSGSNGGYEGTNGSATASTDRTPRGVSSASVLSSAASDVFSNGTKTPTTESAAGPIGMHGPTADDGKSLDQGQTTQQQQQQQQEQSQQDQDGSEPVASSSLLDPQLVSQEFGDLSGTQTAADDAMVDSMFPDNFDWSSLPPICPTGDLAYNILLGVSDGSAASTWGGGGSGAGGGSLMGGIGSNSLDLMNNVSSGMGSLSADLDTADATAFAAVEAARPAAAAKQDGRESASPQQQQPGEDAAGRGVNSLIDGTVIPWQFEGDFGNNSLWSLLNNYNSF